MIIVFLGTLSIDPSLDNQPKQLIIRESMRKFNTDHDRLEICKVSSPRMSFFQFAVDEVICSSILSLIQDHSI